MACSATVCVAGAFVWANALAVRGFPSSSGSMGVHHEFREDVFGWPMPYLGCSTLTKSFAFQPQRPPEEWRRMFVFPYGVVTNLVAGLLIAASTYCVILRAMRNRAQLKLSTAFVGTFVIAVYCALCVHRNAIESWLHGPGSWRSARVLLPDDVPFDMYYTGMTNNFPVSRLLTVGSGESLQLGAVLAGGGVQFPLHVRLPLLFGIGFTFYHGGNTIVLLIGRLLGWTARTTDNRKVAFRDQLDG